MGKKTKPDPAWKCLPEWLRDLMKPIWEKLSELLTLLYFICVYKGNLNILLPFQNCLITVL